MQDAAIKTSPILSVAPMMGWTDRHCRYFHRLLSPHALLYTEMVTTGAILRGDRDRFLRYSPEEHPLALQLGGSDPAALAECARIGADYGYDEINLNCGCPSDRVQSGAFGACLMNDPGLVARCVEAMARATTVPVTVKCRIGVDDCDEEAFLDDFLRIVAAAGCSTFIIHARKAWLQGLSPKENREIPPLNYDLVKKMKQVHPQLTIILNGGITSVADARAALAWCDGAMIGREAYHNPWALAGFEQAFFDPCASCTRDDIVRRMIPYIERQSRDHATPAKSVLRHMLNLFHGEYGGKVWRRRVSEGEFDAEKIFLLRKS